MFEEYFRPQKEDELVLAQEIKTFLHKFVLNSEADKFLIIEFHEFELTPKKTYEYKSMEEFKPFAQKHRILRPRLILYRTADDFFAEFNGVEIQVGFSIEKNELKLNLGRKLPKKLHA